MLPLNTFLFFGFLVFCVDFYQIFLAGDGTHWFWDDLLESEFPVLTALFFLSYGFLKKQGNALVRWVFLLLSLVEGAASFYVAHHWSGQSMLQMMETLEQDTVGRYYLDFFLPMLVSACTVMLTAVSFQIKKPYYITFPSVAPWQAVALRMIAVGFYLQVAWVLFQGGLDLARKVL